MFKQIKHNRSIGNRRPVNAGIIYSVLMIFVMNSCHGQAERDFTIINPYENKKQYPYKASLHNHTQFHPEYFHAKVPADQRLIHYRDYDTEPPYGIVAITDHNRVTTPDNTIPSGNIPGNNHPWGVNDMLWIVGNEAGIGRGPEGGLSGHLLIINASDEQVLEPQWNVSKTNERDEPIVMRSDEIPASVEFSFTGNGLELISCTDNGGGIAKVFINGVEQGEINFFSSEEKCNQSLFQVALPENKVYEVLIRYDRKGRSENKYMGDLIMGSFVVQKEGGIMDTIPVTSGSVILKPFYYKHASLPRQSEKSAEEILETLIEDGCFLVLAHPNSRLVTEGPDTGKQLWNSSGYIHSELDLIFGNKDKDIPSMPAVPHALEIGNRGYDFSERTGYKNAEEKWDYLLAQGHQVWGTASDDSHGTTPREGWIVVYTNASERSQLNRDDVMESLFSGNFYSSQGPNIDIELEDNLLTITTDKPSTIEFITRDGIALSVEDKSMATYQITGKEGYVRARVTRNDRRWRKIDGGIGRTRSAWTNPFYILTQ